MNMIGKNKNEIEIDAITGCDEDYYKYINRSIFIKMFERFALYILYAIVSVLMPFTITAHLINRKKAPIPPLNIMLLPCLLSIMFWSYFIYLIVS